MESKRERITFELVNEGKYTTISRKHISETNQRVKVAMKDVVRVYDKKETQSRQQAAMLVLNA